MDELEEGVCLSGALCDRKLSPSIKGKLLVLLDQPCFMEWKQWQRQKDR